MKIISRRNEEILFRIISLSAATFSAILLFFIIGFIILKAIPAISLPYYLTAEGVAGGIGSAIGNAIIGTIYLSVFATLIAAPFAVTTAIYLSRFASDNKITRFFRFLLEVLSGTPSIVLGIFGLLIIVIYFKTITGGFSLISGAIALAILIIPVIERATEEAINTVDYYLEEGSYALGATKWQTIRGITIPSALTGILTGMILGLGRAAEESAVVILTAGYSQFIPEITIKNNQKMLFGIQILPFQEVVGTLSISVYNAYAHSNIVPEANGFAAAFILIVAVLLINLTAKAIMWGVFGSNLMKKLRVFNLKPTLKEIPSTTVPNSFPKKNPPNAINSNQYPKSKADWRLALTQPIPSNYQHSKRTTSHSRSNPHSREKCRGTTSYDKLQ